MRVQDRRTRRRKETGRNVNDPDSGSPEQEDFDSCEGIIGCLWQGFFNLLFSGENGVPSKPTHGNAEQPLSSYPYQHTTSGYVLSFEQKGQSVGMTASAAYQLINRDVYGTILDFRLRTQDRWGMKLDYIHYNEARLTAKRSFRLLRFLPQPGALARAKIHR